MKNRDVIDQADSYIGKSVVRPQAARLLAGRGVFTDDLRLPRGRRWPWPAWRG